MESIDIQRAKLLGSLLLFTRVFYKLRTGREFDVPEPDGRESHIISLCKAFTNAKLEKVQRQILSCPPRYGKTELCMHFVAWCMAHYPDSNFLYISYSHNLAARHTSIIRQIMSMPHYKQMFGVEISHSSSAKDNFETTVGGSVYAAGAGGTITGRGAGLQNMDRFGGAIIIDDIHKPSEVTSDTIREGIKEWYLNTLMSRLNEPNRTPIVFIGQRLHEDDLANNLSQGYDGYNWECTNLAALDENNNALYPAKHSAEDLQKMQHSSPYVFSAQYQQNPQPAGGGIFKPEWFALLESDPEIKYTFITADTAETSKHCNDATVFSFWGLYDIKNKDIDLGIEGLHWLDCHECWIEPKDLQNEFMEFYARCMRYRVQPHLAAIEKKSTGTTLVSVLKDMQGLHILDILRTSASGSKSQRFLEIQPYIASKRLSFNRYAPHMTKCMEHMRKITANESHRFDDIADTCADAIKLALIDKLIYNSHTRKQVTTPIVKKIASINAQLRRARMDTGTWQ